MKWDHTTDILCVIYNIHRIQTKDSLVFSSMISVVTNILVKELTFKHSHPCGRLQWRWTYRNHPRPTLYFLTLDSIASHYYNFCHSKARPMNTTFLPLVPSYRWKSLIEIILPCHFQSTANVFVWRII